CSACKPLSVVARNQGAWPSTAAYDRAYAQPNDTALLFRQLPCSGLYQHRLGRARGSVATSHTESQVDADCALLLWNAACSRLLSKTTKIAAGLAQMADTSALASVPKMPVRAKQRKPVHQKKPECEPAVQLATARYLAALFKQHPRQNCTLCCCTAVAQKTPEPEDAVPSKRQRRAPAWLAPSTFSIEAVPETLAEHLKKAEPDAKQRSQGGSRMTQWRLINKKCMVVEMEHQGVKYRGCMNRVGLAPTVGTVVENYEPVKLVGGNDGELCAMCEKPLLQQLYPCEAELAQVVRCCVATNWVTHCHLTCGLWAPEVYEDSQGNLVGGASRAGSQPGAHSVNLASAIRRSRALRCMVCKGRGASLGCSHAGCQRVYHLACAHTGGCELNVSAHSLASYSRPLTRGAEPDDDMTRMPLCPAGGGLHPVLPLALLHCTQAAPGWQQAALTPVHLSEYALSRHAPLLSVALEFRNMHLDQPFLCKPLLRKRASSPDISLGYELKELWWPETAEQAMSAGLVQQLEGGRTSVSTSDGSGRVVLHAQLRRFAVCYPLLVSYAHQEAKYHYIWHTQVFSLQGYPTRWTQAVRLLLASASLLSQPAAHELVGQQEGKWHCVKLTRSSSNLSNSPIPEPNLDRVPQSLLPPSTAAGHIVLLPPLSHQDFPPPTSSQPDPGAPRCPSTPLPQALDRGLGGICEGFAPGSWWLEPTVTLLPNNEVIVMEWTPDAVYQFHPHTGEVEAWVAADGSCLASTSRGRFLQHIRPCSAPGMLPRQHLYAASCVPEAVWLHPPPGEQQAEPEQGLGSFAGCCTDQLEGRQEGRGGEALKQSSGASQAHSLQRYSLAPLAAHALKLREQMCAALQRQSSRTPTVPQAGCPPWLFEQQGSVQQPHAMPCTPADIAESFGILSEQVVEQASLHGEGTFAAYADGRVRVVFVDRTIIHINRTHTHAKAYTPDGQVLVVATSNPVGLEQYMQAATAFLKWAYSTKEEQAAQARSQAYITAQLAASRRLATLLDHTAWKKAVPPAITQQGYACQAWPGPAPLEAKADPHPAIMPKASLHQRLAAEQQPSQALGSDVSAGLWPHHSMQSAVQQLLQRNAELLQRL
ncbi:hypothetical protein QJQ45_017217, partial [Haematococcus lacustris]